MKERKIYWKDSHGINYEKYFGSVYKCPLNLIEDHDLGISDINECEKCLYFKGIKQEGWKKLSVFCDKE